MLQDARNNTKRIALFFNGILEELDEEGDIGFIGFPTIFDGLMPQQQDKLKEISGAKFDKFYEKGSFIIFGIAYRDLYIDRINTKEQGVVNYSLWNDYAWEYHRINMILNDIACRMAEQFNGIALTATIGGVIDKVRNVTDYFPMVVSHRAIAEKAGLGWRGKNQLIIHRKYSCAIRFASVIISIPLIHGKELKSECGDCTACEDICGFIRHREKLTDYRENCRRYILHLKSKGIEKDICGKCIRACYRSSKLKEQFALPI